MYLFESSAGRVVRLQDMAAPCTIQQWNVSPSITYQAQAAIITRIVVGQQVNLQFLHTFGNDVYIYVFGDRIGQIGISGLAFACPCDLNLGATGQELIYTWYTTNRASQNPTPVQVTIGTRTLEGFVTAFHEDVVDPSTGLVQWDVQMATLPNNFS